MKCIPLISLVAVLPAVVANGPIIPRPIQHDLLGFNTTHLNLGKGLQLAAAPPPPPRPPPPPPPSRPPPTQPASDDLWIKSRNKGCTLNWAMRAPDAEVGPYYVPARTTALSPYTSISDLQKWLWTPFPRDKVNPAIHDFYNTWGVGDALEALGVNAISHEYDGGKNEVFYMDHQSHDDSHPGVDEQWFEVDGKKYRATGASYTFSINVDDGVIMGLNRKSPAYAAAERVPPVPHDEQPLLAKFSDVAWIGWDAVAQREGKDVKGLNYFLSVGIDNMETVAVIKRALDSRLWSLEEWPGRVFQHEEPEARAIIGTPNVQGFAYFLVQHKEKLGNMFIEKLQVFKGDTNHGNPCIVIHLSQPKLLEEEPEEKPEGKPDKDRNQESNEVASFEPEVVRRTRERDAGWVHKIRSRL